MKLKKFILRRVILLITVVLGDKKLKISTVNDLMFTKCTQGFMPINFVMSPALKIRYLELYLRTSRQIIIPVGGKTEVKISLRRLFKAYPVVHSELTGVESGGHRWIFL
jgi:hypothetical protein